MITCQTIVDKANALLDAEGSDRYLWTQDFKPAINQAIDWLVSLFNTAFADNKISPENLRELVMVRCWIPSTNNRIDFDPSAMGHNLWTILAVYPEATYSTGAPIAIVSADPATFLSGHTYVSSQYSATRLTMEQWNKRYVNPFLPGSALITCDELKQYAYLDFANYNFGVARAEIEISPSVIDTVVAVAYTKIPAQVTVIGDSVEFPAVLTDMIVQKVCSYISYKEGEQTLNMNTEQELTQLITMMNVR